MTEKSRDEASALDAKFEAELSLSPLLEGWALAQDGGWIHAWFFGHPEIEDGTHGHTSRMVEIDAGPNPRWARSENRLYRLGTFYPPAEREIRYWTQKHSGKPVAVGEAPGGTDVEMMITFLRSSGRIRSSKIDRLENAYFNEGKQISSRP
ncbi:hypothetical protein [Neorhizobium alkalisoli]|uniref:hypothetical protein n=1 Tax=Neorhizobium alkalisoli TaxID=528178 RepID=UPI00119CA499|nr:hypothetical protein [Neorhizobium alkalisoli]